MSTVNKSTLFPANLITEVFNKVAGHSSLAKLSASKPVSFVGDDVFTFSLDGNVSVVGESAAKPAGSATVSSKQIRPVKVVYQARVSDEFMRASEEKRIDILTQFAEGFAKKIAYGFDVMAMHGNNPATGSASAVVGNNNLDYVVANYNTGSNKITLGHDSSAVDANIEEAIAKVEDAEKTVTGIVIAPAIRTAMAALTQNSGERKYPDFAFGGVPSNLGGATLDVNGSVSANSEGARVYAGDFANAFRWGYSLNIPLEVIEYGNPDGGSNDLKQANEVCLRTEAFIGWAFLDDAAFAEVEQGE
ncbi:MAG: phage major capsid protein [Clostridiales bacterium]|nr:phage major capsid protein [Clostridiales bacterium]MBQ1572235.1 phage major capsid protein [Clostridiales bacterium]